MPKLSSPQTGLSRFSLLRAAVFAAGALIAGAFSHTSASEPSEFSSTYLDGKEFYGVEYDASGTHPLSSYHLAFTGSTFAYQGIIPAGESDAGPYSIEDGDIVIEGGVVRVSLVASGSDYLSVTIHETGRAPEVGRWYFDQAEADLELAGLALLPKAWISIDGEFGDWSGLPVISAAGSSSEVIDILSVQYATDADYVYFMIEADRDLASVLPSQDENDQTRLLLVSFNGSTEFGTHDGAQAWLSQDHQGSDFRAAGGDFQIVGPRLEGKMPLPLIAGMETGYLQIRTAFSASESQGNYDEVARLFRAETGGPAGGVEFYGIAKFIHHTQTDASLPQLSTEVPFEAEIFLEASAPTSIISASFSSPDGSVYPLERDDPASRWWGTAAEFPDQASMDAAFPDGTYTLNIETAGEGSKLAALNLSGNAYPVAPHVTNFQAAQVIDTTEPFTLTWEPFPGSDGDDFIVIEIEDPVADEILLESGFIPATLTELEIPAGALQPGRQYRVWIIFAKVVDLNTTAFSEVAGLAVYATETELQIQTIQKVLAPGDWTFMSFQIPGEPDRSETTNDIVFHEWYDVEGPMHVQVSPDGEISGDVSLHTRVGNHGQLFFYEAAEDVYPEGYAMLNRNEDVFVSPWARDIGLAVKAPQAAQQADFTGTWNFAALTAGTALIKTAYDQNLEAEVTLTGHGTAIAEDGSQYLVDVQRHTSSADTLTLHVDANGQAGSESLLWEGGGELSLSAVDFPLFVNASRDFTFGMGATEDGDEQTLVLGVRAPTHAEPSWLVGQWRFTWLYIDPLGREYWNPETDAFRVHFGDESQRGSLPGERLSDLFLYGEVAGELSTISLAMAESVGISPDGVVDTDGEIIFLNASGDLLVRASANGWGWEIEIGLKVSDELHPTRALTVTAAGAGAVEAYPADRVELSQSIVSDYLHGETVVVRAEAWGGAFLGWSGDVPAGQEHAEILVLSMDRDRTLTAHFGDGGGPIHEKPWDPLLDSDGDGVPDVLEELFATRDPYWPDHGNLFFQEQTPEGPRFSFIVRDDFPWSWRLLFSSDLSPESWSEGSGSAQVQFLPISYEPPMTQVFVTWPNEAPRGFFRVEVIGPVAD